MPTDCYIPFKNTGYFSDLICDYLDQNPMLDAFYHRFPSIENFELQLTEKGQSYPDAHRKSLVSALKKQYAAIEISDTTSEHLNVLSQGNTYTVVTGHQLNLFTGPIYFLYKIISTINLCKQLKERYGEFNFVPVYWMATEDHDFDEISFFNFKGKKIKWNKDAGGAVGVLSTEGLDEICNLFAKELGSGKNAQYLKTLFRNAYLNHDNLTEATRFLVNELFGEYGLVIVDGDDKELKSLFIPHVKDELLNQVSHKEVSKTVNVLNKTSYKVQVNPREINLFYLSEKRRDRIVFQDGKFHINETDKVFTKEEILKELTDHPERFSPNVMLRPLYQELILPNLCYIGGGGELAYWLELKSYFEAVNIPFPMLLLRNSVLITSQRQKEKIEKLNLSLAQLFLKQESLLNHRIKEISDIEIDFTPQKEFLEAHFKRLYEIAEQTDKSFLGAVKAQEIKQIKGLKNLEKRLLKAQKRKLSDHVQRVSDVQNALFPNQSLQERYINFSELYLEYGKELIPILLDHLNPLKGEFTILEI